MSVSEQDELLLNAYLDGEIAPIEAARFEQRLAMQPDLAAHIQARRMLRDSLRSGLAEDVPSGDLRRRVMASVSGPPEPKRRLWRAMAASFLIGALLAGAVSFGLTHSWTGDDVADAIVSAHIRALMAPQPTDVASPDRHTVKSWFKGKLAFAPVVEDLGAEGFALVGARAICGARLLPRQAFDQPNGNAGYAWAFLIHWS